MNNLLGLLAVKESEGVVALVPTVDGASLIDMVEAYESLQGFAPAGGYAGLLPAGDLNDYYRGVRARHWPRSKRLWLLGCDCGEVGCWPLEAEVVLAENSVTWSGFAQPHRPEWAYTGFGPFVFDRRQYEDAVAAASAIVTS
ncbi:hypothetical protein J4G33_12105 [Actinotalea sp. BY-33]|uniref:Uncharacterized protein n=1 Tax=Actinotalea soli TaxID=2819234 RepID=A0A939RWU9_9CELL|nr:hypothetical protein [Actinotalea soli]MBO1752546.1 hypothetical protein [Actinotalea soli]